MEECLREFSYMADIAELYFQCKPLNDKISFEWNGFNDSIVHFVSETLKRIIKINENQGLEQIYGQAKEKLL